jgi:hypothetical protein
MDGAAVAMVTRHIYMFKSADCVPIVAVCWCECHVLVALAHFGF